MSLVHEHEALVAIEVGFQCWDSTPPHQSFHFVSQRQDLGWCNRLLTKEVYTSLYLLYYLCMWGILMTFDMPCALLYLFCIVTSNAPSQIESGQLGPKTEALMVSYWDQTMCRYLHDSTNSGHHVFIYWILKTSQHHRVSRTIEVACTTWTWCFGSPHRFKGTRRILGMDVSLDREHKAWIKGMGTRTRTRTPYDDMSMPIDLLFYMWKRVLERDIVRKEC